MFYKLKKSDFCWLKSVSFCKLIYCTSTSTMSSPSEKLQNIEIKARIESKEEFDRRIQIAKELSGTDGEVIPQRDVFFNANNGRLKLRFLQVR